MLHPRTLLFLALPAIALYVLFSLYPLLSSAQLSLTSFRGVGTATWVGLENYVTVFQEPRYRQAVLVTLQYSLIVVVLQNGFGLALATLLNGLPAVRSALRVLLLLPSMFSPVIAGFIWVYLYNPLGGGLNALLGALHLGSWQRVWLGDPSVSIFAVTAVHVWMFSGYSAAIYLAGYLGIPAELSDAATIDGATSWQRFWKLDLPLLAPALTIAVTLSTIGTLRAFDLPFVMTAGGPDGATTTLGVSIYKSMITDYRYGLASAISMVLLVLVAGVALIQNVLLRRQDDKL